MKKTAIVAALAALAVAAACTPFQRAAVNLGLDVIKCLIGEAPVRGDAEAMKFCGVREADQPEALQVIASARQSAHRYAAARDAGQ